MDVDEWKKFGKVGIFLGENTFTPVKYLHSKAGSGVIRWKYMKPFSSERVLENVPTVALGNEYNLYVNDRDVGTRVQMFHMDINGHPSLTHLPPSILKVNQHLKSENDYLKGLVADMRKELYDRGNKDRLMKEAIRLGGFRKDFIDAGMTGAEQFGGGRFGGFGGGYGGYGGGLGMAPRQIL